MPENEDMLFYRYTFCQSQELGYTLTKALSKHIYCESIRFYVSAENVFTITGYSGANPEFSQGVLNSGVDRFTYPFSRSYTVGAQVSF